MVRILLITLLIFLMILNSHSQRIWKYEECVEYAIKNNVGYVVDKLDYRKQQLEYRNAMFGYLPGGSASVGYSVNSGRSVNPETNEITEKSYFSNSYGVGFSYTLFDGFRRYNRLKYEKYMLNSAAGNLEKSKNDLVYQVADLYGRAVLNQGLAKIYIDQYKLSEKEYEKKQEMFKLGRLAKADLYEAKARLAADNYLKIYNGNNAEISLLQLKEIMNFPADSILSIDTLEFRKAAYEGEEAVYELAKNNLPELKSMEEQLKASYKQVRIAYSYMMPQLSASLNISTGYYETKVDSEGNTVSFNDQIDLNRNVRYGVSLSIPIFGIINSANSVMKSKIEVKKKELILKRRLKKLEYEVKEALMSLKASGEEYQSAVEKMKSYTMAFEVATKKMEKGMISIMDYYEAKNNLSRSKTDVLRTRIQLFLKEITIKYYVTGSMI